MPIQPSPTAETSNPCRPSLRFCIDNLRTQLYQRFRIARRYTPSIQMKRLFRLLGIPVLTSAMAAVPPVAAQSIQLQTQRADEASRRQLELERAPRLDRNTNVIPPTPAINSPRRVTEACLAQLISEDTAADVSELPLADWVAAGNIEEIP